MAGKYNKYKNGARNNGRVAYKIYFKIFNQMLKSTQHGLQEKVKVSKDPENVQKGRNAKVLNWCTSTLYRLCV